MPKITNSYTRDARKNNTFMERDTPKFKTVQQFAMKLADVGDTLRRQPENRKFAEKLQEFSNNLITMQVGKPTFKNDQIDNALWNVNQNLGKFLKEGGNYQRLVDAGQNTGLLSQGQLDEALGVIGGDMDLTLVPTEEEKEQSRQEEQHRQEEQLRQAKQVEEQQAENDLYALKVDMEEREKAAKEKKQAQKGKDAEEAAKEQGGLDFGGKPAPEEEPDEEKLDEEELGEEELDEEELDGPVEDLNKKIKIEKPKFVNAKEYIEARMQEIKGKKNLDINDLAKIMTARELSGTKGGKAEALEKTVSKQEIEAKARELAGNKQFQEWAKGLGQNGAKELLGGRTHGGKMEKNFTKFLANRPIGELSNDKELKRHMPTAKERIEAIQEQLKYQDSRNVGRFDHVLAKGAAEIIQIRRENHVQRGGVGLDKKIAVTNEPDRKLTKTVKDTAETFGMESLLANAAKTQFLGESRTHGGAMQDFVREAGLRSEFGAIHEYAEQDTRGGRMKALQKEARNLKLQLQRAREKQQPTEEIMEKCRQNALEFYGHKTGLMDPSGKPLPEALRNQALQETIPWERTDKIMKVAEKDPAFRSITKDEGSMLNHLDKEVMGMNLDPAVKQAGQPEQQKAKEIQEQDIIQPV